MDKKYMPTIMVILVGTFVGSLTQTLLTSALPRIVAELEVSVGLGQWFTTIYLLVIGIMVPTTSFLIGKFSTRQLFYTCMSLFFAGSLLALFSGNFMILLMGRVLQAMGTGILFPLLNVIVLELAPLHRRGFAMGIVGLAVSFAPAIAPTLSGWLNDTYGWQSIFLLLSVFSGAILLCSVFLLKNVNREEASGTLDKTSILLSSCGFGGLLLAFTSLSDYGLVHLLVIVPLAVGILSLVFFVRRQLRIKNPLLDVRIFKNRDFAVGTALISLYYFAFLGMGIVLPIYIQSYLGRTAFVSGLTLLPGAFLMAITSPISGWMLDRLGARATLIIGSAFLTGGTLLLVMTNASTPMGVLVADYCVRCIGLGFLIMPTTTWSVDSLDLKKIPDGVAVNNTMRQVMGAIGSALMVTVMSAAIAGSDFDSPTRAGVYGVHMSFLFSAILCAAALILAVIFVRGTKKETFKKDRRRTRHGGTNGRLFV